MVQGMAAADETLEPCVVVGACVGMCLETAMKTSRGQMLSDEAVIDALAQDPKRKKRQEDSKTARLCSVH